MIWLRRDSLLKMESHEFWRGKVWRQVKIVRPPWNGGQTANELMAFPGTLTYAYFARSSRSA